MLTLTIGEEMWDEANNEFVLNDPIVLHLEHSLYAISLWESKWQKSFLNNKNMSPEQFLDYIRCMTLDENVDPKVYDRLTPAQHNEILKYMENRMSATWFTEDGLKKGPQHSNEVVTSELVYYWMSALQIPFECDKWHYNRLMTLIRIAEIKNQPPKKMSKSQIMSRNAALNQTRRAKMGSKG